MSQAFAVNLSRSSVIANETGVAVKEALDPDVWLTDVHAHKSDRNFQFLPRQALKPLHLLAARLAPCRKKMDDDEFPAIVVEIELTAADAVQRKRPISAVAPNRQLRPIARTLEHRVKADPGRQPAYWMKRGHDQAAFSVRKRKRLPSRHYQGDYIPPQLASKGFVSSMAPVRNPRDCVSARINLHSLTAPAQYPPK